MNTVAYVLGGWVLILLIRHHTLTRSCYYHIKDLVRGDQWAAYLALRAQQRRRGNRDTGLHQATLIKVGHPARHVILIPRPLFLLWPARRHLRGVIIRWTPLVGYPTVGWLGDLSEAVAHFLGVDPDDLERTHFSAKWKRVHIVRASVHVTPQGLPYDEFPTELPQREGEYRDVG